MSRRHVSVRPYYVKQKGKLTNIIIENFLQLESSKQGVVQVHTKVHRVRRNFMCSTYMTDIRNENKSEKNNKSGYEKS